MGNAQFRTTDEEERIIEQRMLLAGDRSRSEHFRRIYFDSFQQGESALGEVRAELRELAQGFEDVRRLISKVADAGGGDVEQRLLAAIFCMLYPSVNSGIQANMDRYMDKNVIEKFLEGSGRKLR
jgi:hypothetical protein